MNLYLSSYGLGTPPIELHASRPGARAAIVLNALDQFGPSRARDLDHEAADLRGIGYAGDELDLRVFFGEGKSLTERLSQYDLVWVVGGNSFVLARAMTASGFADALTAQSGREAFAYAGYSAGAVVAGPDLEGIDLVDDPAVYPDDYPADVPASTLGLVPFRVIPHWRSPHPESAAIDNVVTDLKQRGLDHRCLRDGQALFGRATGDLALIYAT